MAEPLSYSLLYAGVPWFTDDARSAAHVVKRPEGTDLFGAKQQRPDEYLYDEIDRQHPFRYVNTFKVPSAYPGRNLGGLAIQDAIGPHPMADVQLYEWYYPTSASRWSVFRGLMTSSMVKEVVRVTQGYLPATFTMQAVPDSPRANDPADYTVSTQMYLLEARPLAETGGDYDGLFLVTLVDDRWLFQNTDVTLRVRSTTTWDDLVSSLATALGVTIAYSPFSADYGQPEPDSPFWCNSENAPLLLDAVAYNVGRVVVRNMDGTYTLQSANEALTAVALNRPDGDAVVRRLGGDLFYAGDKLRAGDLSLMRNAVVPDTVTVSFPKYVTGNDPVPHWYNARGSGGSFWMEESFGEAWRKVYPIASGGATVSGLVGVSNYTVHTAAKATYATEAATTGDPSNATTLTTLGSRIVQDYYAWQAGSGLDETYPGTLNWTPEGFHDIVWTYSARRRTASCRVAKQEWNQTVREMQHGTPGGTYVSRTGKSVSQTWRDTYGNSREAVNLVTLASGLELQSGACTSGGLTEARVGLYSGMGGGTPTLGSGSVRSGHLDSGSVLSGNLASGIINWWNFGTCMSGILCSGSIYNFHLSSGSVYNYHLASGYQVNTTAYGAGSLVFTFDPTGHTNNTFTWASGTNEYFGSGGGERTRGDYTNVNQARIVVTYQGTGQFQTLSGSFLVFQYSADNEATWNDLHSTDAGKLLVSGSLGRCYETSWFPVAAGAKASGVVVRLCWTNSGAPAIPGETSNLIALLQLYFR